MLDVFDDEDDNGVLDQWTLKKVSEKMQKDGYATGKEREESRQMQLGFDSGLTKGLALGRICGLLYGACRLEHFQRERGGRTKSALGITSVFTMGSSGGGGELAAESAAEVESSAGITSHQHSIELSTKALEGIEKLFFETIPAEKVVSESTMCRIEQLALSISENLAEDVQQFKANIAALSNPASEVLST